MYCHGKDLWRRSPVELAALRSAGFTVLFVGLESGSQTVLNMVKKGVSRHQLIEGCRKAIDSGLRVSTHVIVGLGGKAHSREHAYETAAALGDISPDYVGVLSLMLYRGTELGRQEQAGQFEELEPLDMVEELKTIIEHTEVRRPCRITANCQSNILQIEGVLPADRERLILALKEGAQSTRLMTPELARLL
jgi:radical SAM superfamily enzyme YgiQ (UPF0313 family)